MCGSSTGNFRGLRTTNNVPSKAKKLHKRQSSLKIICNDEDPFDIQASLDNHCLFYLKQLLSQSFLPKHTNTELLRSVTISYLGVE
mmetsp:Transcript_17384/g.20180  ORF Transcript_17384/g.20180 Transcript_17384/m.20180 type:complete len:86 (+) Transcript_17384:338-595(+)